MSIFALGYALLTVLILGAFTMNGSIYWEYFIKEKTMELINEHCGSGK